jgi:hypothetical protein
MVTPCMHPNRPGAPATAPAGRSLEMAAAALPATSHARPGGTLSRPTSPTQVADEKCCDYDKRTPL